MASAILYPPILDGYVPAKATGQKIFIPFTFSKFNAAAADTLIDSGLEDEGLDPLTVHAVIYESVSGQSVVNTAYNFKNGEGFENGYTKNGSVYAASGTIINLTPVKIKDDLYQIQLTDTLFAGNRPIEGKTYKIQLRFSGKAYTGKTEEGTTIAQADWLSKNASYFSEWSTVCTLKYTYYPEIQFKNPIHEIISRDPYTETIQYKTENLLFYGNYSNEDSSEYLISYRIKLYDNKSNLLEDTNNIEVNTFSQGAGTFNYELKTELEDAKRYRTVFSYQTNNYFSDEIEFNILASIDSSSCDLKLDTIDFNESGILDELTSLGVEQDDARIALFAMPTDGNVMPKRESYRIKRFSSEDDFKTATVIATFTTSEDNFSGVIGPFYDYNIKSGIIYKYGIQKQTDIILKTYSASNKTDMIIRMFDFSYLLGENSRQLKLTFNQQMSSFSYTVNDSQVNTLGGKYPFITRNGKTNYRQFPITGLISFNMDENQLFITEEELFPSSHVRDFYKNYNNKYRIGIGNNFVYEKLFRDSVLEFLYNDKPKLFKSPTEGNIIVRIMNVSCSPEQGLNKMIYSFSGTAYEVAESTEENCQKYKLVNMKYGVLTSDYEHIIE